MRAIVAGTGHEGRAGHIRRFCRDGMRVVLRREPGNPHDTNAIAVFMDRPPLFGLFERSPVQIGYIKAGAAVSLAKRMDAGELFTATVVSFYAPDGRDYPRVSLEISSDEPPAAGAVAK